MSDARVTAEIKVSNVVTILTNHLHKRREEERDVVSEYVGNAQTYPWKYKRLAGILIVGFKGKLSHTNQLQQVSSEKRRDYKISQTLIAYLYNCYHTVPELSNLMSSA